MVLNQTLRRALVSSLVVLSAVAPDPWPAWSASGDVNAGPAGFLCKPLLVKAKASRSGGVGSLPIELEDEKDVDAEFSTLFEAGRYAEAIPIARKKIANQEDEFGPDSLQVASSVNNLAWLLQAPGDYPKASELFERALKMRERPLGSDNADVATSLNNLAALLCLQGALDQDHLDVRSDARHREVAFPGWWN